MPAMDRLPPLSAVRVFEAAGRLENFSRAAEELGMTQAAVSYQVRQLEDRVGRPLFVRERGRVKLTELGRRLLPGVSSGFAAIGDAFASVREEDEDVLAITTAGSVGSSWLSAKIGRFQVRYPDLAVRVSLSNEVESLTSGAFDTAIRGGEGPWEGMRSDFLFRQHFAPMCSPDFLKAHPLGRPEDLLRVERLGPNDMLWQAWFNRMGVDLRLPRQQGVALDSQVQEASAILGGFGVAMMTPLFWRADLDSGRLVQPFPEFYLSDTSYWLVHPATRVGVRKIERFREWLHEELSADRSLAPEVIWHSP